MHVSAQISLYPLRQDHLSPVIHEMRVALRVAGLDVTPGPMSTMVTGDGAAVFEALKIAFLRTAATGHIVMTATISNACPI
jgi:uncharacterized protein YqgV (UPF0045/DUF77 family)